MKQLYLAATAVLFYFAFFTGNVYAQASVTSSTGYTVNITLQPVAILPSTTNCPFGYNYNVMLHYAITFSGSNIPSSLYTLQGNLSCGGNTNFYSLPLSGGSGNVTTVSNVWNPGTNCTTATPGSLMCTSTTVNIEGPGIAAQVLNVPLPSGGPLAVELTGFTAEAQEGKVLLTWSTLTEINNDHFNIERSTDGSTWLTLATIKGNNNSSTTVRYQYTDDAPPGGKLYFRVKQTDLNGNFMYSETRVVRYTSGDNIYAYPVPNAGQTISFKGIVQPKDMILALRRADGTNVFNLNMTSSTVSLPHLLPGMYTITLYNKSNGNTTNLRYVQL